MECANGSNEIKAAGNHCTIVPCTHVGPTDVKVLASTTGKQPANDAISGKAGPAQPFWG